MLPKSWGYKNHDFYEKSLQCLRGTVASRGWLFGRAMGGGRIGSLGVFRVRFSAEFETRFFVRGRV